MSGDIKFDVQLDENVAEMMAAARNSISLALQYTAQSLWGEVQKEAPVDHGRLAGSFNFDGSDLSWRIYTNVEYALAVHEGTGIHGPVGRPIVIEPTNRKALFWPGASHPVKRVEQDGQRPNPFADRAMSTVETRVDEFIQRAISETVGS